MARNDPLRNFRYRLESDAITQAFFSEVMIGETTIDAVDCRDDTDPPHVRKLSGLTKYGNITLKGGLYVGNNALDLHKWNREGSGSCQAQFCAPKTRAGRLGAGWRAHPHNSQKPTARMRDNGPELRPGGGMAG